MSAMPGNGPGVLVTTKYGEPYRGLGGGGVSLVLWGSPGVLSSGACPQAGAATAISAQLHNNATRCRNAADLMPVMYATPSYATLTHTVHGNCPEKALATRVELLTNG